MDLAKIRLSRRNRIRILTCAAAVLVVLGGFTWKYYSEMKDYRLQLHNTYQRAFAELSSNMNELDAALQKGLYATSPAVASSLCTEIYGKSTAALMSLSQLPNMGSSLENTSAFLSRVGDYAYVLSKNSAGGTAFGETEQKALKALSDDAGVLSQNLQELQADINNGSITIEDLGSAKRQMAGAEDAVSLETLSSSLQSIEQEFPEMPTLVYDGPFSEHVEQMKPLMLEGKSDVTQEQARQAAARFMGMDAGQFQPDGQTEGKLPTYTFSASADSGDISVEVTRQGGVVLSVYNSRPVPSTDMRAEDAVELGKRFLADRGFGTMKESYYTIEDNAITINFAYLQDGVVVYPDLVKVTLALDDGHLLGYDSRGYIMSHKERQIPASAVSEAAARKYVSSDLQVLAHQMTIIPTDGKYEIFCHEFKCATQDGRHYLIYVNAVTGKQEKILILIESENGTLTM